MIVIESSHFPIDCSPLNTPALPNSRLKDKVLVRESNVVDAALLILLFAEMEESKEAGESEDVGEAVLEIVTTHTKYVKSMVLLSQKKAYTQSINR